MDLTGARRWPAVRRERRGGNSTGVQFGEGLEHEVEGASYLISRRPLSPAVSTNNFRDGGLLLYTYMYLPMTADGNVLLSWRMAAAIDKPTSGVSYIVEPLSKMMVVIYICDRRRDLPPTKLEPPRFSILLRLLATIGDTFYNPNAV